MRIVTPHPRGAGRFGCLVFLVGCALLYGGGQGLYTGLTNTSPTEMTLKEYETQRPSASWLTLKECSGFLPTASVRESAGRVTEVYVPLHVHGSDGEGKSAVLLVTKRPEALKLMQDLKTLKEEDAVKYALENREKFFLDGDFTGLVRFGIELSDRERKKLASLDDSLAEDFVILDEGKQPALGFSTLMFAIGLAIVAFSLRALFKGDAPRTAAAPAAPQDQAPNPPDAPAPDA